MSAGADKRPGVASRAGRALSLRVLSNAIRASHPETLIFVGLIALLLLVLVGLLLAPKWLPVTAVVLPLMLASLYMSPRQLPLYIGLIVIVLLVSLPRAVIVAPRTYLAAVVIVLLCGLVLLSAIRRLRLGVAGTQGESMLIDLRDRIQNHASIPALPPDWRAEAALLSAGGTLFSGDFMVAARVGDQLRVAIVDVSGKGEGAGTRALLLSGAFGSLITAVPPDQFMIEANAYLLRHRWDEGFATAVQISLDLATGEFEVWTAGHPPAVHLTSGSGRWVELPSDGPVLGLIEWAEYESVRGVMRRGDAMLMYTDGVVETSKRDIEFGIDRLIGEAEQVLHHDFAEDTEALLRRVGSADDDRTLMMIHRY